MKKFYLFTLLLGLIGVEFYAQEKISGKSEPKAFILNKESKLNLSPDLVATLQFSEQNGDSIIEGGETAILKISLTNKGKGTAQGLKLRLADETIDSSMLFVKEQLLNSLGPNMTVDITIPITTNLNLKTRKHILHINIDERNGFNMDPSITLILYTLEYRRPQLVFKGFELCDTCKGTNAIIKDNNLQAGETIRMNVRVQNIGYNLARNVKFSISYNDQNINMLNNSGILGDMEIGEAKQIITFVSPNKNFKNTQLPLFLSLSHDKGLGNLDKFPIPLTINQKPQENKTFEIKPDMNKFKQPEALPISIKNIEQAPFSRTRRNNAIGIVIGIENYTDLPKDPYAENDAKIISNYFKNTLGISLVLTFTSDQAKWVFFDDMFNLENGELKKKVSEGFSDIFIFYSGHGIPSLIGEQIYLMPSDGKKDRLSSQGINLTAFFENLQHIGARNVTVILETSFSGMSRQSEKIKPVNLLGMNNTKTGAKLREAWINNPNFAIFNSTSSASVSYASDQSSTGLFTYYICLGLQGEADSNYDKKITAGELDQYLQKEMISNSAKMGNNQIPQFHGNKDYVLVEF